MAKLNKVTEMTEVVLDRVAEEEPAVVEEVREILSVQRDIDDVVDEKERADTQRLQLATDLVSNYFNLDSSYGVTKFDDKGKVVKVTLENKDFILNVTIKDGERHGMYVE